MRAGHARYRCTVEKGPIDPYVAAGASISQKADDATGGPTARDRTELPTIQSDNDIPTMRPKTLTYRKYAVGRRVA
jgi:hypothetical protein